MLDQGTSPHPTDQDEAKIEAETLIEQDLLVEDVSIDGMCGVY